MILPTYPISSFSLAALLAVVLGVGAWYSLPYGILWEG